METSHKIYPSSVINDMLHPLESSYTIDETKLNIILNKNISSAISLLIVFSLNVFRAMIKTAIDNLSLWLPLTCTV